MSGIFINPKDTVSFKIYVSSDENEDLCVNGDEKKLISENKGVKKDEIMSFDFVFRFPSYKDNIDMMKQSGAITTDGETVELDAASLRYERFVVLINSWTLVDEEGKELTATRKNIDRLHPILATAILDRFEELVVF